MRKFVSAPNSFGFTMTCGLIQPRHSLSGQLLLSLPRHSAYRPAGLGCRFLPDGYGINFRCFFGSHTHLTIESPDLPRLSRSPGGNRKRAVKPARKPATRKGVSVEIREAPFLPFQYEPRFSSSDRTGGGRFLGVTGCLRNERFPSFPIPVCFGIKSPQSLFLSGSAGENGLWKNGARYRVRTCDPYSVNVVLYR